MSQGYDLVRTYTAGAAIPARTWVKYSADNTVVAAISATDAVIGISDAMAVVAGDRVDVSHEGIVNALAGGTINRGDPITANAAGASVTATPAAGVNNRIGGFAQISAVAGDIFPVLLSIGSIQG